MLKRNIVANYIGQGWVALIGLAFIPLYIKYLGVEAYGLIGLFALLQAWLTLLDMGMTPTLSREMARFTGGSHTAQSIRDLLRSIEVIAVVVSLVIAGGIAVGAEWIATHWLKAEALPVDVITQAFTAIGIVTALRFVEGIYRSAIIGLQQQTMFNVVNCIMATVRGLGAVAVLAWVSPTIEVFFVWQGMISVTSLLVLAILTYRGLPKTKRGARFSMDAVRRVRHFAGGMLGITLLSLLLMQIDKLLLSTLLELSEFSFYVLASSVAGLVFMLTAPITQAIYPHFCELQACDDRAKLAETFHKGAQLVSVFAGSAAIVAALFAETFLRLWTQDYALASRTAPLLSLLIIGNLFNGLVQIPYMAQLAHGWTSLSIKVNLVAIVIIVPAILLIAPRYGAEGAAWIWGCLNLAYIFLAAHFMHVRILSAEKWRWYVQDLLLPLCAGVLSAFLFKYLWDFEETVLSQLLMLVLASIFTVLASLLAASHVRSQMVKSFRWLSSIIFIRCQKRI